MIRQPILQKLMSYKIPFSLLFIFPLLASCNNNFDVGLSPKKEIMSIVENSFVSNTDDDYVLVFKDKSNAEITFKYVQDNELKNKTVAIGFSISDVKKSLINEWKEIYNCRKVRIYEISFATENLLLDDNFKNNYDDAFLSFINNQKQKKYLFHFESQDAAPSYYKQFRSNVIIQKTSWGSENVYYEKDNEGITLPSIFYLKD